MTPRQLISSLIRLFGVPKQPLPAKDPKDFTLTKSSTPWVTQHHWCRSCKTNRSHDEFMASVCNNCGQFDTIDIFGCTIRRIWNGESWISQIKERGGETWLEKQS